MTSTSTGTGTGSTLTSSSQGTSSGLPPTTGADLAGMAVGGLAAIAAGVLSLLTLRSRWAARI